MSAKILEFKQRERKHIPDAASSGNVAPLDHSQIGLYYCPFCGSAPKIVSGNKVGAQSQDMASYIICANEECGVMTPFFYKTSDAAFMEAVNIWNRRVV